MKFSDLSKEEQRELAAYGEEINDEMDARVSPAPGDPTMDPRWDPSRELRRLNYQRHAVERDIDHTVQQSRKRGQSWNTIGRALGITAEAARRHYGKGRLQVA
ncbi:hypothetical protein [Bifidobacterium sp. ESL0790]|uniref:hypothetical protein n=1 Tax=Bifidobacterium sp. ESL0790 TaxID=2983233 RepID=UPI0023FA0345|nr:hypothetical protein [Bifidobacterium sp. ESL0790]WEV72391.1 hypothetical protein OZY47_08245 [Bifidobacterium sp. ESL0790]